MSSRKRYAIVGTGGRAMMYVDAIAGRFREDAQLVGFCDVSQTRMDWHNAQLAQKFHHPPVATYPAADFVRMVREQKPDTVIVTTVDRHHDHYVIAAMKMGCDVIVEKPMATDAPKTRAILQAIAETGRKLRVGFNYRYVPVATKMRELLMQGIIGRPLAVDFNWVLDTHHGADYFRRWHREKENSGGLLVHKASHHFDLINWWIDSFPQTVFAMGELKFYGKANAESRGESYPYERYTGNAAAKKDPFALFLDGGGEGNDDEMQITPLLRGLYYDAEKDSGYVRDRNVFGSPINIEDTMAVTARYHNGVILSYSLVAYSPWEGFRVSISGTKGRLEFFEQHGSHIIAGQSDDQLAAQQEKGLKQLLKVFPMFGLPFEIPAPKGEGGHGGGDMLMLEQLFLPNPPADPFGRRAGHLAGAAAILVGISANESIRTGLPVRCDELVPLESPIQKGRAR